MADEVADASVQQGDPTLTVDQFAAKIKAKYPQYAQVDNATLTDKILAKYPEYSSQVNVPVAKMGNIPTATDLTQQSNIPYTPQYADAHQQAISVAKTQQQLPPQQPKPQKESDGILDKVSQAMYLPAFNQGFNELVTKPLSGANDFVDRTIDKVYTGITGEQTPSWLRKGSGLDNIVKYYDDAYQNRDKPKNIVSNIVEGGVGTMPLMASLFTGSGEASLAAKAPEFISKATKLLGVTGAANAYKDATDNGKDYGTSALEAAKGELKGNVQGLTLDAQMLVGNAFGKNVANALAEKGLKFGGKSGDAILHAIATGTVFGGTSAGSDLLQGKDIDAPEGMKQFGMGFMFEIPSVAKGMNEYLTGKKVNENAAKLATASTAISNMNAESTLRTLMNTPPDQLEQINSLPGTHDELYSSSIEQGAKAYEAEDLGTKNNHYANQMLLKTQADVKLIADKVADPESRDALVQSITDSNELPPETKQDLLDKIAVLTPKTKTTKNQEDGKNEMGEQPSGQEVGQGGNGNDEKSISQEISPKENGQEKVNSGAENAPLQNESEIPNETQPSKVGANGFTTAKGSTYQINDDGTTTRNKAERDEPGHEGQKGIQEQSVKTYYVSKEDADKLGEVQTTHPEKRRIEELPDGSIGVKYLTGKDAGKFERRTIVKPESKPSVGLHPLEIFEDGKEHFGSEITDIKPQNHGIKVEQTGEVGVREPSAVGEGVGGQNKSKEPAQQSEESQPEEKDQEVTYGTKNEITHNLQEGLGFPRIEIPKDRSDDESLKAWKDGTRTPHEIVNHLLDPTTDIYNKHITPNDEPIMREYIRQLGERGRDLNKMKVHAEEKGDEPAVAQLTNQINLHLDEYNEALNASQVGGNIWHKYGNERQMAVDEKGLVVNAIERIRNNYGGDMPKEAESKLKDLQSKFDELQAENDLLQERLKDQSASGNIPKAKSEGKKDYKKERSDILEDLKRDFKKSFAQTNATLPGVPQLTAIAPHVAKLVRSFAEQGIHEAGDIVDKVHDIVKDAVDGITKENIRDIIAGAYNEKKSITELQRSINQIRTQLRIQRRIEQLEKGVDEALKKREPTPEVKKLQEQVRELKKEALNQYANLSVEQLKREQATIQKKIDKGDFFKQPTYKRQWEHDPEWIKNNNKKAELIFELRKMEREALNSQKSKYMRTLDFVNRWGRRVIFFGANAIYTKLASAAVLGSFLHRIPEQTLGKLNSKMFPNIARNAPIEGNMNMAAEAKWYQEFLNAKKLGKDVKDIFLTGETQLSKELSGHPPENHIPLLDFFAADSHAMIKSPVKRATFEASLQYQLGWYEKHGIDPTHPMMLESARQAAWRRANYEVFQDSPRSATKIKQFFNQLERSGIQDRNMPDSWNKIKGNAKYTIASLYHFFIPVNTVPTNILKRIGLGLTLPKTIVEAYAKNKAVEDGLMNLTNEQADTIMLQLKKGQVMGAYWTLGFLLAGSAAGGLYTKFYSDKERDKVGDTGSDVLQPGIDIPKDVQHNPYYQALQMGATWKVVHDHYVDDKDESQMMAIFAATAATAGVAAKQHPVINTVMNASEAIQTPHGNTKWIQDLRRRVGVQKAQDVLKLMGYDVGDDE